MADRSELHRLLDLIAKARGDIDDAMARLEAIRIPTAEQFRVIRRINALDVEVACPACDGWGFDREGGAHCEDRCERCDGDGTLVIEAPEPEGV